MWSLGHKSGKADISQEIYTKLLSHFNIKCISLLKHDISTNNKPLVIFTCLMMQDAATHTFNGKRHYACQKWEHSTLNAPT